MTTGYDLLKEKLPEILEITAKAPIEVRAVVCQSLISELRASVAPADAGPRPLAGIPASQVKGSAAKEIPGIAVLDESGALRITARDLKAKTKLEQAKRLAYVAIRANEILTGTEGIEREIVTNLLKAWRLYDGNSRGLIANDKGIQREGSLFKLDTPGKREADDFMQQIVGTEEQRSAA